MPQPVTFNVENYFESFADKSAMEEAARFRTIPTGTYRMQVTKHEGIYLEYDPRGFWKRVFADDHEVKPGWRPGVRLTGSIFKTDDPSKKLRVMRIDASWDAKRDGKTGEYDKFFKRWEQLTRALFPQLKPEERAQKPVGEVIKALMLYPVGVYVSEAFQVPAIDGSNEWKTPKTSEEVKQYKEAGYKAENFIQNVTKVD